MRTLPCCCVGRPVSSKLSSLSLFATRSERATVGGLGCWCQHTTQGNQLPKARHKLARTYSSSSASVPSFTSFVFLSVPPPFNRDLFVPIAGSCSRGVPAPDCVEISMSCPWISHCAGGGVVTYRLPRSTILGAVLVDFCHLAGPLPAAGAGAS